jgi:hypothetical protein
LPLIVAITSPSSVRTPPKGIAAAPHPEEPAASHPEELRSRAEF